MKSFPLFMSTSQGAYVGHNVRDVAVVKKESFRSTVNYGENIMCWMSIYLRSYDCHEKEKYTIAAYCQF